MVLGDSVHNSFDNVTFGGTNSLITTEDRGDTLHDQLNTLDSIWAYNTNNFTSASRFVALGLDRMATEETNEPTGIQCNDGNSTLQGLLGFPTNPQQARFFFTQQHGENNLYKIGLQ